MDMVCICARGACASVGYTDKIKGTLGAPEFVKRGERVPGF